MALPQITTAIPKRRYQLGEFLLVLLDEIESSDGHPYRYLLGVIPEGKSAPELFITSEKATREEYRMRMVAERAEQDLGTSPYWGDVENFCLDALLVLKNVMDLMDEEPLQLA